MHASGSIKNVTLTNIGPETGCQAGRAILVDSDRAATRQSVKIEGNNVSSYNKNGIDVRGNVDAKIVGNTVTGRGQTTTSPRTASSSGSVRPRRSGQQGQRERVHADRRRPAGSSSSTPQATRPSRTRCPATRSTSATSARGVGKKPAPRTRAAGVATPTPDGPHEVMHRKARSGGPSCAELKMTPGAPISHTSVMATGLKVGGDVEKALESVGVPSYVLDTTGIVRWINPAAEQLVGDIRGRHFTSVVAPEDSHRARELFSRKVLGASPATDATGVLVSTAGTRVAVEISAVPLMNGERVVGVFGLFEAPRRHAHGATPASHSPPSRGASSSGAGLLDEADRRRAPPEHRDGQEPRPPSLSGPRRQFPTRSRRRRPGRITPLSGSLDSMRPLPRSSSPRACQHSFQARRRSEGEVV